MLRTPSRAAAVLAGAIVLVGLGAAACSSSKHAASQSTSPSGGAAASGSAAPSSPKPVTPKQVSAVAGVSVSGKYDSSPTVTIGKDKPPTATEVAVVSRGSGAPLKNGDLAVVDDFGRTWTSSTPFQNTYGSTTPPDSLPVGSGQLSIAGLDQALVGVPAGSRVLVVIPPSEGFGSLQQLPSGVKKTDTAVLVFDVLGGFARNAGPTGSTVSSGGGGLPTVSGANNAEPTISIPKSSPPSTLSVTTLVQGTGPAAAKGQELVVQYVGEIWASGKEFDSSWKRGSPVAFPIGQGQLIPAWDTGLVGVKVGSRVLMVVPPASGYGSAGQSQAGISGTDTLVFVVDVLGAYNS